MTTNANAVPIGQLLSSSGDPIVVPRVQRPYSWETPEVKELWEDIIGFSQRYPGTSIVSREYFMGAVVGQMQTDQNGRKVEILDGQQRLATLTILMSVLRDKLQPFDANAANVIQSQNIEKFVQLGAPAQYLLTLNRVDRTFFRREIQESPRGDAPDIKSASHSLIRKARLFFEKKFDDFLEREVNATEVTLAFRLHSIINSNLKVVFIHSDTWDDVSDVFERLNDRGKGLSTLNLLRNHVLSKAPEHQQEDIEQAWEQVYSLSQSASKVDTFLRHVWITYRGDVKKQSLFKEIKAVMDTPSTVEVLRDPYKFSLQLASDADLYKEIMNARHSDPACARWLRAIQTMNATSLMPAALACSEDRLTTQEAAHLLRALVTTFVRYSIITGGDSSSLETAAYKVAQHVRGGGSLDSALDILRPLLRTDDAVIESFENLTVPSSKSGYQRHLLEELENHLSDQTGHADGGLEKTASDAKVLWIEHIYPQHPGRHWDRWEEHDSVANRMGNLTLVHKKLNGAAGNKPFVEKVRIYALSGVKLNDYLTELASWTPSEVESRQKVLAKMAPEVWPRF
ncbi:DUF262 domain-containing protein [Streptomyces coelicoflavus]|uniref:DUF262 domain-containing protein n=1 Tax=Streptomyces coelicoflavus TaxID=285562 RepID=UPI0036CB4121